jgi:hypothetical protein
MGATTSRRAGDIVFRTPTAGFALESDDAGVRVVRGQGRPRPPLLEIMGSAEDLSAVLLADDARRRFLEGGVRIRGDIRYLSDLAVELGVLKRPLFLAFQERG